MAAAAAGRGGGSSSYSHSSSSSGTVASPTYTSSASRLSPVSMEAALHLGLEIQDEDNMSWEGTEEGKVKRIKTLVQEFFAAPPADCSTNGGGTSALGKWLTELGVGWLLHLAAGGGACAAGQLLDHASAAPSWIGALAEIVETIGFTDSHFPGRGRGPVDDVDLLLPGMCEEEEDGEDLEQEPEAQSSAPNQFQLARFIQETLLKMLAFVDAVVALDPDGVGVPALHRKISILLPVRAALSKASSEVSFIPTPSAQAERVLGEMVSLLSAKQGDACEAIWSTLEEIRSRILRLMHNSLDAQTTQGSSAPHKVTLSVMDHINFLQVNWSTLYPIVTEATTRLGYYYVPRIGDQLQHLDGMIMEAACCLEEKLVNMSSASFPDEALRFLFLLNNLDLIRSRLLCDTWYSSPQVHVHVAALSGKIECYMESYLHVSWAPLLSCLFNPTPLCLFGKYYYPSTLPKFESEFHKTHTTQKLWKVPDPVLRRSLRTAITETIIPCYTRYIEDNNISTPTIPPKELEGMLQELFEG